MGGTRVISGHGYFGNEADAVEYRDMVHMVGDRLTRLITTDRRTLEQVKAERPFIGWEGRYSQPGWTTDMLLEAIYPEFAPAGPAPRQRTERR